MGGGGGVWEAQICEGARESTLKYPHRGKREQGQGGHSPPLHLWESRTGKVHETKSRGSKQLCSLGGGLSFEETVWPGHSGLPQFRSVEPLGLEQSKLVGMS